MSSHREAPEISKDPVADSTDVYAFVSPDKPDTVTLIANYIPLQGPAGGPNFYEFGDDVLYEIHIDNDGDGQADITYQFRFQTRLRDPDTFLYNIGPILSLDSPNWNRRQFYSVTRIAARQERRCSAQNLPCPPCNIGPLSTPNYADPGQPGGARASPAASRCSPASGPRASTSTSARSSTSPTCARSRQLHAQFGMHVFSKPAAGRQRHRPAQRALDRDADPDRELLRPGKHGASDPASVIGVWTTASRQQVTLWDDWRGENVNSGPFRQVSRLGNPLVNEVLIPLGSKDLWNSLPPNDDKRFASYVAHPELAGLLPVLYPGVFPNLEKLVKAGTARADLEAILLTGIPTGIVPGFQNYTGPEQADMLRLNIAIPPAKKPNALGLIGGDLAGFPNGRRVFDDVVTDRAARDRRGDVPAGGPEIQARRGGRRHHRRADGQERPRRLPEPLPVPRGSAQWIQHPVITF